MLDWIQSLDVNVLIFFNQSLQSETLDYLFPYFTNLHKITWVKYVVFPLVLIWWFKKSRSLTFKILLALVLTAGLSDTLGYRVIKPNILRVRPNNNPEVASQIRVLRHPQSGSFPSNHSMNSFAVATVAIFYYPQLLLVLYPLATVIALFRLYAGVHYPTDIIAGALLGVLLGSVLYKFVFRKIKLFKKD